MAATNVQEAIFNIEERIAYALDESNEINNSLNNNIVELLMKEDALLNKEQEQTDLLNYIASNLGGRKSDLSTLSPSVNVESPQIDNSQIVNELSMQTDILRNIAEALNAKQNISANPSESNLKALAKSDEINKGAKNLVKLIVALGGAFLVLGAGLSLMKNISTKDFLIISGGLTMLFLALSQIAKGEVDIKKSIATLLLISGTLSVIGLALSGIAEIETGKMMSFMLIVSTMISSMTLLGKADLNIGDVLVFDAFLGSFVKGIVNASNILSTMVAVDKAQIETMMLIAATIVPAYSILAYLEKDVGIMSSISLALAGFIFPKLVKGLVAVAKEVNNFPKDFRLKSVIDLTLMAAAMQPFVNNTISLFRALTPISQMGGIDAVLNKLTYTKAGGLEFKAGGAAAQNVYLSTLFRLGASFAMLPLTAMSMLAIAWMFSTYMKAGGTFQAPPIAWSASVGIAMYMFSMSMANIMEAVQPTMIQEVAKESRNKSFYSKDVTKSNLPGSLAILGVLSLAMVTTAYILSFFPKRAEQNAPDTNWVLKVGFGLILFSKALMSITKFIDRGNSSAFSISREGRRGGMMDLNLNLPNLNAFIYMNAIAFSMVSVAHILTFMPSNPISPPITWVLSVGFAMLAFAKAYHAIATVTTGSGGVLGSLQGVETRRESSSKRAFSGILFLNLMAMSMVSVAFILQAFPKNAMSPPLGWTISTGFALVAFAKAVSLVGKVSTKNLIGAFPVINSIALSVVSTAYIFQMLPDEYKSPDLTWILKSGLALVAFSLPIYMLMKAKGSKDIQKDAEKNKGSRNKGSLGQISLTALAIVTTSWIFQLLPDGGFKSPPIGWTLQAGLSLVVFGFSLLKLNDSFKNVSIKDMQNVMGINLLISTSILATAWLFQLLPNNFKSPDILWGIKVTGSILLFAGAMAAVHILKLNEKQVLKTTSIISLIAISIVTMSWIFQTLPTNQKMPDLKMIGVMAASIVALGGALAIIGFIARKTDLIERGIKLISLMAIPIITLSLALLAWRTVNPNFNQTLESLKVLTLTVGALALIGFVLGHEKAYKRILLGLAVLTFASLPIIALSYAIKNWTDNIDDYEKTKDSLILFGIATTALVAGLAIVGQPQIAGSVALGALVLAGIGGSLYVIGKGIGEISSGMSIGMKSGIFEDSGQKSIFGRNMTYFEVIMDSIAKGFAIDPITSSLMALSAPGFLIASSTMLDIAEMLQKMKGLDLNTIKKAKSIIPEALSVITDSFAKVGSKNKKEGFNFIKGLFVRGPVAEGIYAIKGAGKILSEISTGLVAFANMVFTDIDGKKIKLNKSKLNSISDNIILVLDTLSNAFKIIGERNKKDYGFSGKLMSEGSTLKGIISMAAVSLFTRGPVADGIKSVQGMGLILSEIANGLTSFANMKFTDANGKTIEITGDVLEKVYMNVSKVMTALGKVFADIGEGYNTGGFMGFFGANQVDRGVSAVKGVGNELVNIVSAIKDVANLVFKGEKGEVRLTEDMLTYVEGESLTSKKQGSIIRNIARIVSAVSAVFAHIGKEYNTGGIMGFFGANDVNRGIEAVKGIGDELLKIVTSVKDIGSMLDEGKIDSYEKNIPRLISIIPKAVIDSFKDMDDNSKEGLKMLSSTTNEISNAIGKIAKYEKPIEKVATSFKTIADSMGSMKDAINTLDEVKLEKTNSLFAKIKDIAYPIGREANNNITTEIANGISEGIARATEQVSNLTSNAQLNVQAGGVAPSASNGNNDQTSNMMQMFQNLEAKFDMLNQTMQQVALALSGTLDVNIKKDIEL